MTQHHDARPAAGDGRMPPPAEAGRGPGGVLAEDRPADPQTEPGAGDWAERLWRAVAGGDEHTGAAVVFAALDAGLDEETVLLDVIGTVQRRVGAEWAADRMTVAAEHAATAVNERLIAAMAHRHPAERTAATAEAAPGRLPGPGAALPPPGNTGNATRARTGNGRPPTRGRITVACTEGEWHALPARLLAEVLRLRGWHVDYLGATVPTPHLISHLHRTGPDALALSASLAVRLPTAHAAITACQATGVPVLAGGAAFGPDGRYATALGADAWAPDARAAAELLEAGPLRRPRGPHHVIDDLPHLADQEYTLVTRTARDLVRATLLGLEDRVPAVRAYDDDQRERTAEDIAHIVQFLATSLYTADPDLFTGFMTWTADVLAVRGVPAGALIPALDLLADQLGDFPRAVATLDRARTDLTAASGNPA
ncbi:cobalamin B12-binding domain-containing protein [Kitasatospora sp. NPDC085895]|uniref:cobalamin B12-binding domain-containing protein n=1 Tax=Kitasatospora sp. NPDC085895 TaxID=3155057 RepID=UPI00344C8842